MQKKLAGYIKKTTIELYFDINEELTHLANELAKKYSFKPEVIVASAKDLSAIPFVLKNMGAGYYEKSNLVLISYLEGLILNQDAKELLNHELLEVALVDKYKIFKEGTETLPKHIIINSIINAGDALDFMLSINKLYKRAYDSKKQLDNLRMMQEDLFVRRDVVKPLSSIIQEYIKETKNI